MKNKKVILGKNVVFRVFNSQNDANLIVRHLYSALDNEKGMNLLKKEDREFFSGSRDNIRLVAEIDKELVASIVLMRKKDEFNVFTLYSVVTAESYQGSGLSGDMFDFACSWVIEHQGDIIVVWTDINNIIAQKFYVKCGFKKETEDENYYYYSLKLKKIIK